VKLKLGSYYADRLNLNGDQANIPVLAKRAAAYGLAAEVSDVFSKADLDGVDLLVIGHGSIAAWASIQGAEDFLAAVAKTGILCLAIGSGAERFAAANNLSVVSGERSSRFEEHHLQFGERDFELVGYANTTTTDLKSKWFGNAILTTLHGPLLAKNPEFADWLLEEVAKRQGAGLPAKPETLVELDALASAARRDALR
jgi:CobQ-like glutamine amidotransferase family enzyme